MDTEKILEGLSQEERLELLERLIQGAERAHEESLGSEERLERLESLAGWGPWHWRWGRRGSRGPWRAGWAGCPCGCW